MSNRTTRVASTERKRSRVQSSTPANAADNADRALASIRAWSQLLVARGNRLIQLAEKEREEGRDQSVSRKSRASAPARANAASRPTRVRQEHAKPHAKPLA